MVQKSLKTPLRNIKMAPNSALSAIFSTFFVSGISFGPTDLCLLKGFSKNLSFEDFQNFQEIGAYCGLDLMIVVL